MPPISPRDDGAKVHYDVYSTDVDGDGDSDVLIAADYGDKLIKVNFT